DADALGVFESGRIDEVRFVGRQLDLGKDLDKAVFLFGDVVGQHGNADAGATGLQHAIDGIDPECGAARAGIGAAHAFEIVDVAQIGWHGFAEADDAVIVQVLGGGRHPVFVHIGVGRIEVVVDGEQLAL